MSPPPISWLMVEGGWTVRGSAGDEVGHVVDVLGDPERDIFNGITVRAGRLGSKHYVPAEAVAAIEEGAIELAIAADEVERLDADPPGES